MQGILQHKVLNVEGLPHLLAVGIASRSALFSFGPAFLLPLTCLSVVWDIFSKESLRLPPLSHSFSSQFSSLNLPKCWAVASFSELLHQDLCNRIYVSYTGHL